MKYCSLKTKPRYNWSSLKPKQHSLKNIAPLKYEYVIHILKYNKNTFENIGYAYDKFRTIALLYCLLKFCFWSCKTHTSKEDLNTFIIFVFCLREIFVYALRIWIIFSRFRARINDIYHQNIICVHFTTPETQFPLKLSSLSNIFHLNLNNMYESMFMKIYMSYILFP